MKPKLLELLAVGLMGGPMAAQAVTLQINGDGILTGASDVNVGGVLMTFSFSTGPAYLCSPDATTRATILHSRTKMP